MKHVAIFGAGSAMKDFLSILPESVKVVGLGDNDPDRHGAVIEGHKVHDAAAFARLSFDRCVIAARAVDEIRAQLIDLGISKDRISAYYPSYSGELAQSVNADIAALNADLGLQIPAAGIASMYMWADETGTATADSGNDFVRRHAFRLAAEQIARRGIEGAVAELGVYKGEQAALLNRLFPGRPLHLFDTFEGFSAADIATEQQQGFSAAAPGDFQDTSVDLVRAKLESPENVLFHKGYFPETTRDVEAQFAFVSLDVDLYEPTIAGLEWFYSRLAKGGYIFVHDYNNKRYMGVRQAVERFLLESGACAFPLPDFAGSIVVTK